MTQETLELATKLLELKKSYELKLSILYGKETKIAISFVPSWKEDRFFDREEYLTFYDDKELVNLVKDYCEKKIEDIQNQIEAL